MVFKGKKPEKVAHIKAHIASRILSGMEKETPLHEETLKFELRKWCRGNDCRL